ncbi:MAG TPA: DUF4124 domain-containing protein [Nevskiaceae bacterium]|nr:DUF4124 domain-containing protein [Nevskiaceae bacterium]
MATRVLTLVVLAALACPALAADTVYRWKDANGRLHYGDLPAADAEAVERVDVRTGTKVEPEQPPVDEAAAIARRVEKCAQARSRFASYSSAVRLVEKDALGREHVYTAEERDALIAKQQGEIEQFCADAPTNPDEEVTPSIEG